MIKQKSNVPIMAKEGNKTKLRSLDESYKVMMHLWVLFILAGLAVVGIIGYKLINYRYDEKFHPALIPQRREMPVIPVRGNILDSKNRILATSTLNYTVRMDTKAPEQELWDSEIANLAAALDTTVGLKSTEGWIKYLNAQRRQGKRYAMICRGVSQLDIIKIRKFPIFCKGQNKGGYIEERAQKRLYPYGRLAFRTIGYVKDNTDSTVQKKGIEGQMDSLLHGVDGVQVFSRSDFGLITVADESNYPCKDGMDVRTTIDIDVQGIADRALRAKVEESELIEKSCVIVLETTTGAVKAMVNLGRDETGVIGEWDNYALRNAEAPGSVFKGAVLMAMMEEGKVNSLNMEIPTYGGIWEYRNQTYNDSKHLNRNRFPSGRVKIWEAFEMSANNTFRQLVCDYGFGDNPGGFVDRIKSFGITDTIDFDLNGTTPPFILDPSMRKRTAKGFWDNGTLPRLAIGYNMELTPLNIVTFYNAIANNGRMMKPYLLEAVLQDGKVVQNYGPSVMRECICSEKTIKMLKQAMGMVTTNEGGTAYRQLHGAVCPIAGKTGTAQRLFKMGNGKYGYRDGNVESQQATFVGFFPQDKPKYTAIVVMWSKPSSKNFFGASYSAPVFREIADRIYCLNEN